jgi:hypothetical protein
MADKTYIELCKNDVKTVSIDIWRDTGEEIAPSAAFYTVKGSAKDNIIVPRTAATLVSGDNRVQAKITTSVTASATEYDIYWELHKDGGDTFHHCTKCLIIETC